MSHMLLHLVSVCLIVLLMPGTSFSMNTSLLNHRTHPALVEL